MIGTCSFILPFSLLFLALVSLLFLPFLPVALLFLFHCSYCFIALPVSLLYLALSWQPHLHALQPIPGADADQHPAAATAAASKLLPRPPGPLVSQMKRRPCRRCVLAGAHSSAATAGMTGTGAGPALACGYGPAGGAGRVSAPSGRRALHVLVEMTDARCKCSRQCWDIRSALSSHQRVNPTWASKARGQRRHMHGPSAVPVFLLESSCVPYAAVCMHADQYLLLQPAWAEHLVRCWWCAELTESF
jgi:hypothetical protein